MEDENDENRRMKRKGRIKERRQAKADGKVEEPQG